MGRVLSESFAGSLAKFLCFGIGLFQRRLFKNFLEDFLLESSMLISFEAHIPRTYSIEWNH